MSKQITETMSFKSEEIRRDNIKQVLRLTKGYLISNDPAYISSHHNARSIIQSVERYEIIEELVRSYLEEK